MQNVAPQQTGMARPRAIRGMLEAALSDSDRQLRIALGHPAAI